MSKKLDKVLENRMVEYVYTLSQFSFNEALGTELCIYPKSMGSHMFVCALDTAGAFDSIPFITLFKKLLCRNTHKKFLSLDCLFGI